MRIIAGRLGGRRLVAPPGEATRPTSDRVREALFSILGDLSGAIVLDLYAGTGALGIEALSRGATRALFVEEAGPALRALRRNLTALGLEPMSHVLALPVARAHAAILSRGPFDLVFADPPYEAVHAAAADLAAVLGSGALRAGARVVLEHATGEAPPDLGLEIVDERRYGTTSLTFLCVAEGSGPTASS